MGKCEKGQGKKYSDCYIYPAHDTASDSRVRCWLRHDQNEQIQCGRLLWRILRQLQKPDCPTSDGGGAACGDFTAWHHHTLRGGGEPQGVVAGLAGSNGAHAVSHGGGICRRALP